MFIGSSDEEPLLPPQPQKFVRQSQFRVSTRRPPKHSVKRNPRTDTAYNSTIKHVKDTENELTITVEKLEELTKAAKTFPTINPHLLPESNRVDCLPPLPPKKDHEENSQKYNLETFRKWQAINCRGDLLQGSLTNAQNVRSSSSSPIPRDSVRKSHSFSSGRQTPSPRSSVIANGDFVDRSTQENDSIPREPWTHRWFSSFHRPPSPSSTQRKSPSPTDASKQMQNIPQNGNEPRKGFHSLFKRSSPPPIFYRSLTTSSEERSSHDSSKGFQLTSVNGRPSTPTNTHPTQPLSVSYQRERNISDPISESGFKRHGSFPLQRKELRQMNRYLSPSRHKDLEDDPIEVSATFRKPSTPIPIPSLSTDLSFARHSYSENRKNQFQKEGTNCLALLPSSRRLHYLRENKKCDPETVSVPIERDPRYKKDLKDIKLSNTANTPTAAALNDNQDERSSRRLKSCIQRTNSLPATRVGRDKHPQCTVNKQDTRSTRSYSLNYPAHEMDKPPLCMQQPHERADGCGSCSPTITEGMPVMRQLRPSPSVRSRDSIASCISDVSIDQMALSFTDHQTLHQDLNRRISSCSTTSSGTDIYDCFERTLCEYEDHPIENKPNGDHISYLLVNDKEYLTCLENMLDTYERMCNETPPHIRQHFDVLFKQVGLLYQFHIELHNSLKQAGNNLLAIANAFEDRQFQCYRPYMIMSPAILKDLHKYSTYFNEHFPHLKADFLKPSVRINFYGMLLDSMKKSATEDEKLKLKSAIDYLFSLKRQANTEMTIKSVYNSPVDLRLCGDILVNGDLFCYGAGPLQKRKYHTILFESVLLITSSKTSYFKYKIHYRIEQLEDVQILDYENCEFILKVLAEGQLSSTNFRFKVRSFAQRDEWVTNLQKLISQSKVQYPRERYRSVLNHGKTPPLPLSLCKTYPQLFHEMTEEESMNPSSTLDSPESFCHQLISQEKSYVKQIESLLNPDSIGPPEAISMILGKFYNLHKQTLLPELEMNMPMGIQEILTCLNDHIYLFQIYLDYFVVRCQLNYELERSYEAASLYISPVQHFTKYMTWLKQVKHNPACTRQATTILQRMKELVLGAQVRLLSEAIVNGRIDFYRSGNLLRNDVMEVKTRQKGVNEGFYNVLLFKKIIVLTKLKQPLYEYIWDIWLNQVNIGPPSSLENGFKLEVRQGRGKDAVTFEFRAQSLVVQQIWIRSLQEELIHQAEKIKNRASPYNY